MKVAVGDSTESPGWLNVGRGFVTLQILARPGSSRRGIIRADPRGLLVAVHSSPEKGRANDDLIRLLARQCKVPRSSISILRGATNRLKLIRIETDEPKEILRRLGLT